MFNYFFFAKNLATGEVCCFATKYLPVTDTRPSRFAYWEINCSTEAIPGTKRVVSWAHGETGQIGQLKVALGAEWQVFDHFQTLQKLAK